MTRRLGIRSDFEPRVRAIDWSKYETAYGSACGSDRPDLGWGSVGDQLVRLASRNLDEASEAQHQLWCGLCHQHVTVSSAALPALPFLLEVLDAGPDEITRDVLDICLGFATGGVYPADWVYEPWHHTLRDQLQRELPRFHALTTHTDPSIVEFATEIVAALVSRKSA
ncbi:MAG: hypothetical protein AB7P03_19940 [Kofleriaceae bacterium]